MDTSAEPRPGRDRSAAQELVGLHGLAAGALQFKNAHRALSACHHELMIEQHARRAFALAQGGAQNLDASGPAGAGKFEPGARARSEAADVIMHAPGRLAPVDARLVIL